MADMTPLTDILNNDPATATPVQNNFQTIEAYINGTDLIRADGTEVMAANLDMDGNKVVNLAAGTVTGNAVEYDQMNTAIGVLSGSTSDLPLGVVAYGIRTSTQNVTSTIADATGLTGTWTAVSTRLYRVSFSFAVSYVSTPASFSFAYITDSSNNQKFVRGFPTNSSSLTSMPLEGSMIVTGLSGATTWKVRHQLTPATASVYVTTSSATNPAYFLVEDLGLA